MIRAALLFAILSATPWEVPAAALKGLKNPVAPKQLAASIERGRTLYAKECAGCHGPAGKDHNFCRRTDTGSAGFNRIFLLQTNSGGNI